MKQKVKFVITSRRAHIHDVCGPILGKPLVYVAETLF
jgi:hypothetical protein